MINEKLTKQMDCSIDFCEIMHIDDDKMPHFEIALNIFGVSSLMLKNNLTTLPDTIDYFANLIHSALGKDQDFEQVLADTLNGNEEMVGIIPIAKWILDNKEIYFQ